MQCTHELDPNTCASCKRTPNPWTSNPAYWAGFPCESRVTVPLNLIPNRDEVITDEDRRTLEGAPVLPLAEPCEAPQESFWTRWQYGKAVVGLPSEPVEQVRLRDLDQDFSWSDEQRTVIAKAVRAGMPWDSISRLVTEDEASEWEPWYPMPSERAGMSRALRPIHSGLSEWRAASGRVGGFAPPSTTLRFVGETFTNLRTAENLT